MDSNRNFDFNKGELLLIDKPYKWTSRDVVNKIRNSIYILRDAQQVSKESNSPEIPIPNTRGADKIRIKIGHAGTLDPLATGLLIICTGKMTKKISEYQNLDKTYTGEMILGKTTPSYDLETEFDNHFDISHITDEMIYQNTTKFSGSILQKPPAYSALKIKGERSYKKARRGEDFQINPREVFIKEFLITNIALPKIEFKVTCSKGTYIRSLVKDFGEALNAGACLSALRRTRIGKYKVEDAYKIEEFIKVHSPEYSGFNTMLYAPHAPPTASGSSTCSF
ncbi:MAG: tRNA pseudouridine(55) synthase TruB [Bacteroidetes bacterium]|nr:tRNA pseudouridine(55) synthase TruB [Bacteroidota bacterium]